MMQPDKTAMAHSSKIVLVRMSPSIDTIKMLAQGAKEKPRLAEAERGSPREGEAQMAYGDNAPVD